MGSLLLVVVAACGGTSADRDEPNAFAELAAMLSSQSLELAYDSILEAGPNESVRRLDGEGVSNPSDLVVEGRVAKVAGAHSLVHTQDPETGQWTSRPGPYDEGVPVVELTVDVDAVNATSDQFGATMQAMAGSEIAVEFGPPPTSLIRRCWGASSIRWVA